MKTLVPQIRHVLAAVLFVVFSMTLALSASAQNSPQVPGHSDTTLGPELTEDFRHLELSSPEIRHHFHQYLNIDEAADVFKVFVMRPISTGGWAVAWDSRTTLEGAIRYALKNCGDGFDCSVFAVGNYLVWGLDEADKERVFAAYRRTRSTPPRIEGNDPVPAELADRLTPKQVEGLRDYLKRDDRNMFKIFAAYKNGAYAWRVDANADTAHKLVAETCASNAHIPSYSGETCELIAIGNELVAGKAADERARILELYRNRN